MFYPDDFSNRVKEIFPNDAEVCDALERGDLNLGLVLSARCQKAPSVDDILSATSLEKLKEKARAFKATQGIFNEWRELCQNYNLYNG